MGDSFLQKQIIFLYLSIRTKFHKQWICRTKFGDENTYPCLSGQNLTSLINRQSFLIEYSSKEIFIL